MYINLPLVAIKFDGRSSHSLAGVSKHGIFVDHNFVT